MQREKYRQLRVGDLVEIHREDEVGFPVACWQATVMSVDKPNLVIVKGYTLPELLFEEIDFGARQSAVMHCSDLVYAKQLSYSAAGSVQLFLHPYMINELPICNECARYMQRPKKAFRKGGREIFSPYTCMTLGCTVAWWGNKGSYPADQKTRTARKLLLEELRRRGMFIDGLNIGRLNEQEALAKLEEICKPKTFYSNPAPLSDYSISLGIPKSIAGSDSGSSFSSAAADAAAFGVRRKTQPGRARQAEPPKIFRDMELD